MTTQSWRCFHCDEVFTDYLAAQEHFGVNESQAPACKISISHVRWLEEQQRRSADEDTEVLRVMRDIISCHEQLRRQAEEAGYTRGLADAKRYPAELGLQSIAESKQ